MSDERQRLTAQGAERIVGNGRNSTHKGVQPGAALERLDELLTVDEVAQLLKVPKSWVYERTRYRGTGQLPFIKLGKYLRFEESAIRTFLEQQRRNA
jgi:excisionase family DNA binding protein